MQTMYKTMNRSIEQYEKLNMKPIPQTTLAHRQLDIEYGGHMISMISIFESRIICSMFWTNRPIAVSGLLRFSKQVLEVYVYTVYTDFDRLFRFHVGLHEFSIDIYRLCMGLCSLGPTAAD